MNNHPLNQKNDLLGILRTGLFTDQSPICKIIVLDYSNALLEVSVLEQKLGQIGALWTVRYLPARILKVGVHYRNLLI